MPARFYTIAVRGMHYGRYGAGGEDPRLMPLFIGYPEFVRGYGVDSFAVGRVRDERRRARPSIGWSAAACWSATSNFVSRCSGRSASSDRMYGPLPVEVAFFLDGGVTWNRGQKPSFFNGDARAGHERRRDAAHEPARLRNGADRLRKTVRSARARMGLGVLTDAGF